MVAGPDPEMPSGGHRTSITYDRPVAYDEELADRIRDLLRGEPDLSEMKMFGGLAFLIGGNMSVAASSQGGVLVRFGSTRRSRIIFSARRTLV